MKSLIIWLPTGQTMKFEDVRDFKEELSGYEDTIRFSYRGVSTDVRRNAFNYQGVSAEVRRNAVFEKAKVLGWALEQEDV